MTSQNQPEPSMEEILASIRRIISEDGSAAAPAAEPDMPEPAEELLEEPMAAEPAPMTMPENDVFDLTPDMRADEPPPPPPPPPPEPEPEPMPVYTPEPQSYYTPGLMNEPLPEDEPLMSPQTEAVAASALAGLGRLASGHRFEGDTVEGLVREMLRPMLRDWMDHNLPTLVERLVEAEIERLSKRQR